MKQLSKRISFTLPLCLVILSGLACNLPSAELPSAPKPPSDAPVASAEDAQSFKDKLNDLDESTQSGGDFSATFTEAELTSIAAESVEDYDSSFSISNVTIVLEDGLIYTYGTITYQGVTSNGLLKIIASTLNGKFDLTIDSIEFGLIDLDPSLFESLITDTENSVNNQLSDPAKPVTLTGIIIDDGLMTLNGTTP